MASMEPVSVHELKQVDFLNLPLKEQIEIKKRGRSTPDLPITMSGTSHNKKYRRSFNAEWYERKSWLCGCEVSNALYCFPCILYGGDPRWTTDGFNNITRMKESFETHERNKKHLDNVISLSLVGNTNIMDELGEANQLSICEHNLKVKRNRDILSKIIDCIFFCENFESYLRELDEKDDSVNTDIFKGVINFASKFGPDLKTQLETSPVFKDITKSIQNEILDCLLQIYFEEITREINEAPFVAVMAEDITDTSEITQMVIVLRYVVNGEIVERFWGFFSPENQDVDGIAKGILDQLEIILQCNNQKLIAQTFDGPNVIKGKKNGVQSNIKAVYPNANFVDCYTHQLDSILRNAASIGHNSRIFFANILAIPAFFSKSPQRVAIFKNHTVGIHATTSWDFSSKTVSNVYEKFQPLKNCLYNIQTTCTVDQTISEATGICKYMNDNNFLFWLKFFHKIMSHLEILYSRIHLPEQSSSQVISLLRKFQSDILEIRNSKDCDNPWSIISEEAKQVCDCLCKDVMDRFSFTDHLMAEKLFYKRVLSGLNKKQFTEGLAAVKAYPMIDFKVLEIELSVLYSRSELHKYSNLLQLLQLLLKYNLDDALSETVKLLKILLTIPMKTGEVERCFSTLTKIRTFLRNTQSSDRLNALAVLSLEKKFLGSHPELKERVINLFAQNENRQMDFAFKPIFGGTERKTINVERKNIRKNIRDDSPVLSHPVKIEITPEMEPEIMTEIEMDIKEDIMDGIKTEAW